MPAGMPRCFRKRWEEKMLLEDGKERSEIKDVSWDSRGEVSVLGLLYAEKWEKTMAISGVPVGLVPGDTPLWVLLTTWKGQPPTTPGGILRGGEAFRGLLEAQNQK